MWRLATCPPDERRNAPLAVKHTALTRPATFSLKATYTTPSPQRHNLASSTRLRRRRFGASDRPPVSQLAKIPSERVNPRPTHCKQRSRLVSKLCNRGRHDTRTSASSRHPQRIVRRPVSGRFVEHACRYTSARDIDKHGRGISVADYRDAYLYLSCTTPVRPRESSCGRARVRQCYVERLARWRSQRIDACTSTTMRAYGARVSRRACGPPIMTHSGCRHADGRRCASGVGRPGCAAGVLGVQLAETPHSCRCADRSPSPQRDSIWRGPQTRCARSQSRRVLRARAGRICASRSLRRVVVSKNVN
ncbi:hypothetical protein C8R45DRAFT_349995 [Mycena sanguinolenta]|nr:hypothetical protein C8R45DRAFT_349995 [Mycena sanguinolenta]